MDNYKVDSIALNQERKKSVELYLDALSSRDDNNINLAASNSVSVRMARCLGRQYKKIFGAWNTQSELLDTNETPSLLTQENIQRTSSFSDKKLEISEDSICEYIEGNASAVEHETPIVRGFSTVMDKDCVQGPHHLQKPNKVLESIYQKIPSPRLEKRKFPFTVEDAFIVKNKTSEYIFALNQAKDKILSSLEAKHKIRDSLKLTLKNPGSLKRPSSLFFGDQYSNDLENILQKDSIASERYLSSDEDIQNKQIRDIQKAIDYADTHYQVLDRFITQNPSSLEAIHYALELYEEAALVAVRTELKGYCRRQGLHEDSSNGPLEGIRTAVTLTETQIRKEIYDIKASLQNLAIKTQAIGAAKVKMEEVLARNELFRGLSVKTKLKNAQVYCLNTRPWDVIDNPITLFLDEEEFKVRSVIIPAKQLGNIFDSMYECEGVCSHSISENVHAVNLAKTLLCSPDGQILFEAYRHGVHCAYGITQQEARWQANINRAVETIQAMVIGDPFILENAKGFTIENPLDLDVLSINLQTGDRLRSMSAPVMGNLYNERLQIEEQMKAWAAISHKIQEVKYYDQDGKIHGLFVKPAVHAVNFGVNSIALEGFGAFGSQSRVLGSWKRNAPMNQHAIEWLFGANHTVALGGRVEEFLRNSYIKNDHLKQRVSDLALHILDIYHKGAYASTGHEPYKIVTRLAYMCYLMGIKVAFNCKSGKDRTGMMDVETKFLVSRSCQQGSIPRPDEPLSPEYQEALYILAVFSGNHEMQKMNTGIAGYKADNSQTIQRLGGESVTAYLRGPSAFVSA